MKLAAFEAVAKALTGANVRFLVAGGLAVNAHGYIRLTMDIDLVIALDSGNIHKTFATLAGLGYQPTVPIRAKDFAQPEKRQKWHDEKGMQVLNFHSDRFHGCAVDVFIYAPFDFKTESEAALCAELLPNVEVSFVSIPTLIQMKELAGRPRDLDDIQHLKLLQENHDDD